MSTHQAPCCGREPITHSSKNLPKKNRRFGWDVSQLNKTLKNCVFSEKISYKTKVFKSSWWKPESNVMIFPMGFPWNNVMGSGICTPLNNFPSWNPAVTPTVGWFRWIFLFDWLAVPPGGEVANGWLLQAHSHGFTIAHALGENQGIFRTVTSTSNDLEVRTCAHMVYLWCFFWGFLGDFLGIHYNPWIPTKEKGLYRGLW